MTIAYLSYLNTANQPVFSACLRSEKGKSPDGEELMLTKNDEEAEAERCLELELIAFQALDSVDIITAEQETRDSSGATFDCFLGLLGPCLSTPSHLDVKVYGMISSTRTKVIVILERCEVNGIEVKHLCRALMRLYADAIANPFYDGNIETEGFLRKLKRLIKHYDTSVVLPD